MHQLRKNRNPRSVKKPTMTSTRAVSETSLMFRFFLYSLRDPKNCRDHPHSVTNQPNATIIPPTNSLHPRYRFSLPKPYIPCSRLIRLILSSSLIMRERDFGLLFLHHMDEKSCRGLLRGHHVHARSIKNLFGDAF